jgi:hypothetical protein
MKAVYINCLKTARLPRKRDSLVVCMLIFRSLWKAALAFNQLHFPQGGCKRYYMLLVTSYWETYTH